MTTITGNGGYIDKTGQVVLPIEYDAAFPFSDGLAAVQINGEWGYIDTTGQVVIPLEYHSAGMFSDGLAAIETDADSKIGFIDKTGQLIIPAEYYSKGTWSGSFAEGLASVADEAASMASLILRVRQLFHLNMMMHLTSRTALLP